MQLKFAQYKGYQVGYESAGEGNALFFIPGFAETTIIFDHIRKQLSSQHKIITVQLPGISHSSDLFNAEECWTIELMAELIFVISINENIDRFCLIGHSMGGYISLAFASKYPEKLAGFGLMHSTAFPDSDEYKIYRKKSVDFLNKYGAAKFLELTINNLYTEEFKKTKNKEFNNHLQMAKTIGKEILISQYKAMMLRQDHCKTLSSFTRPVLFMAGENDNLVPLKDTLNQSIHPELLQINIMKDTGHMGFIEKPDEAIEILRNYCNLVFSNSFRFE